jgi:signal transduction histidine kinase
VQGFAPALRRAVLALVENAIDHTPPLGEVLVRTRRERGAVIVSVSDTGPGIDPGAAHDVLRRFHSGGQRAGRAHYGLGLALTHDVANRHGGQLRLAASGVGATFELVLPGHTQD